jgi:hypothetical protein
MERVFTADDIRRSLGLEMGTVHGTLSELRGWGLAKRRGRGLWCATDKTGEPKASRKVAVRVLAFLRTAEQLGPREPVKYRRWAFGEISTMLPRKQPVSRVASQARPTAPPTARAAAPVPPSRVPVVARVGLPRAF